MNSERDKVVPHDIGLTSATVSEAALFSTEYGAFLTFNALRVLPDGSYGEEGTAIVQIERCSITKFGYPNEEALGGHPLAARGLSFSGVYEVLGSSWIEQMAQQNRVCFPETPDPTRRHFIFTFQDSTFECVAESLQASLSAEPYDNIVAQIIQKLFRHGTAT